MKTRASKKRNEYPLRASRPARTPRLLIVEAGGGFGGSMRSLVELLSSPEWKGWAVEVALTCPNAETRLLDEAGVPCRRLDVPRPKEGGSRVLRYLKMLNHLYRCCVFGRRFASEIRRRRIDLVHLNNELFAGLPVLFGARFAGLPVTCHLRSQRPPTLVERAASLLCTRLVSISATGADFFRKRLPVPGRVCAVNDPFRRIETQRRRMKDARSAGPLTVGMLSNFVPGKGHEFFIDAVPRIARRFPGTRFVAAGKDVPGFEGCMERMRARAEASKTDCRVEFLPWQSDVPAFLSRLDVLVDCSNLFEGYRRTIVEGMLAGAAVVATDVGPAREIISDGVTGMLVGPRDAESIAAAVCTLLGEEELREKIARAGHAAAQKMFSLERSVNTMQGLFIESAGMAGG